MTLGRCAGLTVLVIGLSAGCGGGSSPTQPSPTPAPAPAPPALQPTFSSIQANVFSTRCSPCHSGATPEANLRLVGADAYANLVNVASTQRSLRRVAPNDSDNSYLIHKLEGRGDIVGLRMPPPPFVTSTDMQIIRQWIDQGAANN
jgi:hypothetical protein